MDREVFFIVDGEEISLGLVSEVLSGHGLYHELAAKIKDMVDDMVYSADERDYAICSIEVRY